MQFEIQQLSQNHFPPGLLEIPQIPKQLYLVGSLPDPNIYTYVAIVGSRNFTNYGKLATEYLIESLKGLPVVIVSGLALGIDSIAHRKALEVGLLTIAIPGSGLAPSVIYPRSHLSLAEEIIKHNGALLSEYKPEFKATHWSFPARNRIMAGLCNFILIIETEEKSGTLITAKLGTEYNKEVLAVPGSIFSDSSRGTNCLIEQGATPITSKECLLRALGFKDKSIENKKSENDPNLSADEKSLLSHLTTPKTRDELGSQMNLAIYHINMTLSLLELKGYIKEEYGTIYRI